VLGVSVVVSTYTDGDFYVLTSKGETFLNLHETYLKNEKPPRTRLECLEKEITCSRI
jgi:hypothetical protein